MALWSVRLAQEANEGGEDEAMLDASADEPLCTVPHEGCVLDLATGCAPGLPPLLFTGSGAGGVACYAVRDGRSLTPHWREGAAAHDAAETEEVELSLNATRAPALDARSRVRRHFNVSWIQPSSGFLRNSRRLPCAEHGSVKVSADLSSIRCRERGPQSAENHFPF